MQTCSVDKYKDKSPNYSLSKRYYAGRELYCTVLYYTILYCTVLYCVLYRYAAPGDRVGKPGPGAYMSEKVNTKQSNPEYSFGVKHSKYVFMAKPDPGIPVRPLPY